MVDKVPTAGARSGPLSVGIRTEGELLPCSRPDESQLPCKNPTFNGFAERRSLGSLKT